MAGYYPSAYYGNGGFRTPATSGLPEGMSRAARAGKYNGREARDGYVNPVGQAWDSDWYIRRNEYDKITDVAFIRRFCGKCGAVIRTNSDGLKECSNPRCARIFDGGPNDWPVKVRYVR